MLEFTPSLRLKHKDLYLWVFNVTKKAMHSDQNRKLPIMFSWGNTYIYITVAVELDENSIDAEPIQSRKAKALTEAYHPIFNQWKDMGEACPN